MPHIRLILALPVFSMALVFSRCSGPDYSGEIRQLDSLYQRVDSLYGAFNQAGCDSLRMIGDSVTKHLAYIQGNYAGPMRREMADQVSRYRTVIKLIPRVGERKADVDSAVVIVKKQLAGLRSALQEKATHDAMGNAITSDYVTRTLADEKEAAQAVMKEMELIISRAPEMKKRYLEYGPRVWFWVDSIPVKTEDDLY